ncbi:MAG: MFS transporter, partial [Clostridia bacterium]
MPPLTSTVRRRRLGPRGPNAVAILWTEPAWSLAMAWQTSYLTVYLVRMGLAPAGVGAAVGLAAVVQVAGLLVSGYLVDHLGRKVVIMAGDFVGWVLTLGLWVLDPRPLVLALGVVLLNGFAFVTPAWNSLFAEDVEASRVSYYFLILQGLTLFGGLVVPLLAPVVAHTGVKTSGHVALAISWPLVTLAWLLRVFWLRESSVGHAQRAARKAGTHPPLRERLRHGFVGVN